MAMTAIGRMAFGNVVEPKVDNFGNSRWGCGLVLSDADVKPLGDCVAQAIKARKEFDPRFKPTTSPIVQSMSKNEDGTKTPVEGEWLVRFDKPLERKGKDGSLYRQDPPMLWDSLGNVVNGKVKDVPWGSMIKVKFEFYGYDRGAAGVKFEINGIQIVELAETDDAPPPIDGGWVIEEDTTTELLANA